MKEKLTIEQKVNIGANIVITVITAVASAAIVKVYKKSIERM